jgi:hypothetical protein
MNQFFTNKSFFAKNNRRQLMKSLTIRLVLLCLLLTCAGFVQAQTHYPAGVEGIKGASLPPPGLYIRDYNYTYFANEYDSGPPKFDVFANVQAPRLVFITPKKILGGYYGADLIVPLIYQDLDVTGFRGSHFGVGDIFVEPVTLSWHKKQADFSLGYGFWAPTGDFSSKDPAKPGKGFWTHMLTAGVTVYPDKEKTWSFSALNRYEFNQERKETHMTPGQYWTIEWGLAKSASKTVDLGFVGYFQAQTTSASGLSPAANVKDHIVGLGPEITLACPKLGLSTSIRYFRETGAQQHSQGNVINVIFTRLIKGPAPKGK